MRLFILCFLSLIFSKTFAQNGYELQFDLKKSNHDSLIISEYLGSFNKQYKVHAVPIDKKGVTIIHDLPIVGGIYRIQFNGAYDDEYINIAVDNGDKLKFSLKSKNIKDLEADDPVNSLFIELQNSPTKKRQTQLMYKITKKYPNSVAALYSQVALSETQERELLTKMNLQNKIQETYFDQVDLNDVRIQKLPNIYSSLFKYVQILPINNENYKKAIDDLLKGQDCDSPNFMFYLKWTFMNLEYLNRYNLYNSFVHVFNNYMNQGKCIALNENFYNRVVKNLQSYEKVPIGSIIPDFDMVNMDGSKTKISKIYPDYDYTFVAFYDPDCSHCKKEMPDINYYFNQLKSSQNVNIKQVAFLNAVSDYKWKTFIEEHGLYAWQHVKSEDASLKYIKDLDVFANPSFFLVDRNGMILMKNFNANEMNNIFKKSISQ